MRRRRTEAVDLLVNNAGFGLYGEFVDMPMPRIQEMLVLHLLTVTKLVRLFLPEMRERRKGAIINVASVAGLLPLPYLSLYAATKAFMVSLGAGLALEAQKYGVMIQTCCPGRTATDFQATAGIKPYWAPGDQQTADEVVSESLAALDRGCDFVVTGWRNRLLTRVHRDFGAAVLVDCHSMPSTAGAKDDRPRADIVIGDRYGTSCVPMVSEITEATFRELGYAVSRNKPYAGGFITEHYGNPAAGLHSIQIEINRALYMDERRYERSAAFARVAGDITLLADRLAEIPAEELRPYRAAAE